MDADAEDIPTDTGASRPPLTSPWKGIDAPGYHGLMTPGQRLRQIANILNGSTLLGLLLAACARTSVSSGPRGLLIASRYRWRLPFAAAFTVGNVILFRAGPDTARADPALLRHEERHSTQYAWCLGLPFLPLYFIAAGWSLWRTGNPGSANFFERHAGLEAGGYPLPGTPGTSPWTHRRIGAATPKRYEA
ncbi:hypothetical protein SAMN04487916_10228 [Arthrobacter sp. ov407]|nr:hypothetical protein SAMN04487916_10228 [Arthrobacter sp. ov407]